MRQVVNIAHLYPREMNIYGDMGNIITLVKRLEWRGYEAQVRPVEIGEQFDWNEIDLVFGGGGQDSGQLVVSEDLVQRGPQLRRLAEDGLPMLMICGLYQLFGRRFVTGMGEEIRGIGIFGAETKAGSQRMIGNVVLKSELGPLVGFENHSGQTVLDRGQAPLGKVVKGWGNTPRSGAEGARIHNVIGTYLHGPVLPKNPVLADWLLLKALQRKYDVAELAQLNDSLEAAAAKVAMSRPR